jgi:hypothetical protein
MAADGREEVAHGILGEEEVLDPSVEEARAQRKPPPATSNSRR